MFNYVGLEDSGYWLFLRNALLQLNIHTGEINKMSNFAGASDNFISAAWSENRLADQ